MRGNAEELEDWVDYNCVEPNISLAMSYPDLGSYLVSAGTCMGDSGGPLFVEEDGQYIVTGA